MACIRRISPFHHSRIGVAPAADASQGSRLCQHLRKPALMQSRAHWWGKAPDWGWARLSSCTLATKDNRLGATSCALPAECISQRTAYWASTQP